MLETFDIATVSPNCARRNYSNVATQSLMMMNSQFVIDRADHLAKEVIRERGETAEQITLAWQRCFARPIETSTLDQLTSFVDQQADLFQARDPNRSAEETHRLAVASACQAMLSSNPFLYVD